MPGKCLYSALKNGIQAYRLHLTIFKYVKIEKTSQGVSWFFSYKCVQNCAIIPSYKQADNSLSLFPSQFAQFSLLTPHLNKSHLCSDQPPASEHLAPPRGGKKISRSYYSGGTKSQEAPTWSVLLRNRAVESRQCETWKCRARRRCTESQQPVGAGDLHKDPSSVRGSHKTITGVTVGK